MTRVWQRALGHTEFHQQSFYSLLSNCINLILSRIKSTHLSVIHQVSKTWPIFFIPASISHLFLFLYDSKYRTSSISNGFFAYSHTIMSLPHFSTWIVIPCSSSSSPELISSKKHVTPQAWAKCCVWSTTMLYKFLITLNICLWISGNYLNVPLTHLKAAARTLYFYLDHTVIKINWMLNIFHSLVVHTFSTSHHFKKTLQNIICIYMCPQKSVLMSDQELSNPGVKWFILKWFSASLAKVSAFVDLGVSSTIISKCHFWSENASLQPQINIVKGD